MTRSESLKQRSKTAEHELYARLGLTVQASDQDVETAHKEIVRFLRSAPDGVSRWAQSEIAAADEAYALLSDAEAVTSTSRSPLVKRVAPLAVTLVVVAIVFGVYKIGGDEGGPAPKEPEAAQTQNLTPADQAQVAQLVEKVNANPKDVASLIRLGDIYFKVGDYAAAGGWMNQAVTIDPRNVKALLGLGAAQFNLNGIADAQRQWLRVIEIDPKNVEAYYDLGFLYLSKKPPDMAAAKKAWRKVVALDPDSEIAKSVATHLKGLKKSPSGTQAGQTGVPADPTTDRK